MLMLLVEGGGVVVGVLTVTVTDAVLVPFALVAVRVYCVVAVGATVFEVRYVTSPTPLLILTDEAPETLQASVTCWPAEIVRGVAVNELIVGAGDGGVVEPSV